MIDSSRARLADETLAEPDPAVEVANLLAGYDRQVPLMARRCLANWCWPIGAARWTDSLNALTESLQRGHWQKPPDLSYLVTTWRFGGSNPRPSACKTSVECLFRY